ncbi:hypothetical protein GUJ93_ZPchr0007g5817 [Zizania palustris]|uniref:Uncharacterized protein n=1 Tax=Zizania palustris TaxID=103762 RepID=A0A8J5TJQ7_ZIZPA|nr:hypothetical protein GUJ93_ZPchr0007g5817 [Zizania palustris]
MEVCRIVPNQRYQKKLSESQLSNLIQLTRQSPSDREMSIHQTVEQNEYNSSKLLQAPELVYRNFRKFRPVCGQWNMKNKAGGRNTEFAVRLESLPVVSNKPTIIFGAGVTHPGALDDSSPSIASVVASDWPLVTKYNSVVRAQGHRVELIRV